MSKLYSSLVKPRRDMVLLRKVEREIGILLPRNGGTRKMEAKAHGIVVAIGPKVEDLDVGAEVIYLQEGCFDLKDTPEAEEEGLVLIAEDAIFASISHKPVPVKA